MLVGTEGEVTAPPDIAELSIYGVLVGPATTEGIGPRGMAAVPLIVMDVDVK